MYLVFDTETTGVPINYGASVLEGVSIKSALEGFLVMVNKSHYLIAHNIKFDHPIVGAEMVRLGLRSVNKPVKVCTMLSYQRLVGGKWPKLEELHKSLFNEMFDGAHDALNDVKACAKCFFKMKELGIIDLNNLAK